MANAEIHGKRQNSWYPWIPWIHDLGLILEEDPKEDGFSTLKIGWDWRLTVQQKESETGIRPVVLHLQNALYFWQKVHALYHVNTMNELVNHVADPSMRDGTWHDTTFYMSYHFMVNKAVCDWFAGIDGWPECNDTRHNRSWTSVFREDYRL